MKMLPAIFIIFVLVCGEASGGEEKTPSVAYSEEEEIIKNLELLRNFDFFENMELVKNYDEMKDSNINLLERGSEFYE